VNGRIVPLTYELKNGDQVAVLTAKAANPSRDWLSPHLNFLRTHRARAKVRQWFRQQDLEKSIVAGRGMLEKELQRLGVDLKRVDCLEVAKRLNFNIPDELFAAIGYGDINTAQAVSKVQELVLPRPPETLRIARKSRATRGGEGIKVRGVGNLLTQIASCCQPVPDEPIAGYITRGRGVAIHRNDCANLLDLRSRHPTRIIEVDWGEEAGLNYSVEVQVEAFDRPGLLKDITSVFLAEQINVTAANTYTDRATFIAHMTLTLEIKGVEQLSRVLDKIAQIPNIMTVKRKG
jgi:GTP pyrophosphokinase